MSERLKGESKMRDRLIELLAKSGLVLVDGGIHPDTHLCQEALADYLLSEGVIVPPCKVGDILYAQHWCGGTCINGDIMPYQITNITITQNKKGEWTKKYRAMEVQNGKTIDWQLNFEFDAIGKTVFHTREEAEKSLAERSENGK